MSGTWEILSQSKTSETLYTIAKFDNFISTVTDILLDSITSNPTDADVGTAPGLTATGGTGTNAVFTVVTSGGAGTSTVTGITATAGGRGYSVGDVLTIASAGLPGPPSTNLVITLTANDLEDGNLNDAQASPITDPTAQNGATVAFNVEGYGQGVIISYEIASGNSVKVVLDINNDPALSDSLWVATAATNTSSLVSIPPEPPYSNNHIVSSKNSYRAVRLRFESVGIGPRPAIINIRLMCNS